MLTRVRLAQAPTPILRLERVSAMLGAEVYCKRDDLTGLELTGNKVRKLERLLADAVACDADTIITTGGIQSNHARATAFAARKLGMEPVLLLRGERPERPESNLLLDNLLGAKIFWCTPEEYRARRNERMAELASDLSSEGRRPYIIPEGGSNAIGAVGYADAAREVAQQMEALKIARFDAIFCAVGSGGTLAGLALGPDIGPVIGVAVCDDAAYFEAKVRSIADEARALSLEELDRGELPAPGHRWSVLEGYQGPGYAIATDEIWQTIATVAREEALLVDPVYTGKAMHALLSEVRAGRVGGKILFWHTGGAFGLFGRGEEVARCASPS